MKKNSQRRKNGSNVIRLLITTCDFLIMIGVLNAFVVFKSYIAIPHFFLYASKMTFIVAVFCMCIAEYMYSTIIHIRHTTIIGVLKRATKLVIVYITSFFICSRFLTEDGGLVKFGLIYGAAMWCCIILSRYAERTILKHFRSMGRNTRSVIFVGSDPANLLLYQTMVDDPSTGYKVIGYFSDDNIKGAPAEFKRLGSREDLKRQITESMNYTANLGSDENSKTCLLPKCDEMFVSMSHSDSDYIITLMKYCDNNVIHFYYVPRLFTNFRLHLKPETIFDQTLFTNRKEPLTDLTNRFIKRIFDVTFSSVVIICLLPFFPIIALIIKLQSPGPVFFRQDRTGLNGETFRCLKFRSMHISKDADLIQATKNDPRKFAFGNFMRKTNIDELPQFLNVLKGDMSIVGPRPHMLHHTEMYNELIDKYMVRHFCKPGITGWAQVTGYRGETKELWQMEERVKRDIWYIENWSSILDIQIIFMTIKTFVVHDKNAY